MHLIDIIKVDQQLLNNYLRASYLKRRYQIMLKEIEEFNEEKFFDLYSSLYENYISAALNALHYGETIRKNYLVPKGYCHYGFFPDTENSAVLIYPNEEVIYAQSKSNL